jgi:hypothetical protein
MLKVLINHVTTSGLEKTHYMVLLARCTDGKKLLPLLIFKRKMMPGNKIPQGIYIHILAKGWMDESEVKLWLEKEDQSCWVAS